MSRDGSGSSGSWKSSPWKYGPRARAGDRAAGRASTGPDAAGPATARPDAAEPDAARPDAAKVLAGPAGGARLADLREWHIVEARCAQCRHVGRLRPKQITAFIARRPGQESGRRLAGQTRLAEIAQRFACRECGNRQGNRIAVLAVERNG